MSALKRHKRKLALLGVAAGALAAAALLISLLRAGVLHFNYPTREDFPVRGVDVSVYQGEIDWPLLAGQGVDFAFIKATEGSGMQDSRFADNWAGVRRTHLRAGAYHFFSYDSPGESQAANFIRTVPVTPGALPPVVDVEFYGKRIRDPATREETDAILQPMLAALEAHYGQKPILYATYKAYMLYLKDAYPDNPIWIRDVYRYPRLPDRREWTFWQYTARMRLPGYKGPERFIDMNAFNGTLAEFEAFASGAAR